MARKSVETFSRKNNENKTGGAKKSMKKLGKKYAKKSMKKRKVGKKLKGGNPYDQFSETVSEGQYAVPYHPELACKKEYTIGSNEINDLIKNIGLNEYFITVSSKSTFNNCIYTLNVKLNEKIERINFTKSDDGKIIDIKNYQYPNYNALILKKFFDYDINVFNQYIPDEGVRINMDGVWGIPR